ncbi:MAG TPA: carboxypeptidase-like regulatory domain-containing protein [Pyrinomonadaceae bacterium]|jgi:hypothetical protein
MTLSNKSIFARRAASFFVASCLVFVLFFGFTLPIPFMNDGKANSLSLSLVAPVAANNIYYHFTSGNLSLDLTSTSTNMITTNDDWSGVSSVEGYDGKNLSATHGVDPQTILGTEFASNALPSGSSTQVNANKGNPSAFNAGGLTEFDTGTYLAFGFQGNVQANPYMVFYINTTGYSNIIMSYRVQDIDTGSNDSVSPVALQYRVGTTGNFVNVPAGFITDATDGPNLGGRTTSRSVTLPAAVNNQPQVQVRIITTNAAATDGTSTPDEWIGVNSIVLGPFGPTAAGANVGGRVYSPSGTPLANTQVLMYDNTGGVRTAISNAFGYYRFEGVTVGEVYLFEVRSKRYAFTEAIRTFSVQEDFDSLDFHAASASIMNLKTGISGSKY